MCRHAGTVSLTFCLAGEDRRCTRWLSTKYSISKLACTFIFIIYIILKTKTWKARSGCANECLLQSRFSGDDGDVAIALAPHRMSSGNPLNLLHSYNVGWLFTTKCYSSPHKNDNVCPFPCPMPLWPSAPFHRWFSSTPKATLRPATENSGRRRRLSKVLLRVPVAVPLVVQEGPCPEACPRGKY